MKNLLLENINVVSKAVSSKSTLPILECIMLTADESLKLTANDLSIGIESKEIDADIAQVGNIAIEAKVFLDIIRKMPSDFVTIETDENNITHFSGGKTKLKILGSNAEEFPLLPQISQDRGVTMNASMLKDMIKKTSFSIAPEDSTRANLTGEFFQVRDNQLRVVAIDGYRISFGYSDYETAGIDVSAIVPGKSIAELYKILPNEGEDEITIYFSDKHILFELPYCTMLSRIIEADYIRYDQIFNEDYSTIVTIDRLSLLDALERSLLISRDSKKNPIRIEISDDAVILTSTTELGTSFDEISADIDGQNLEIAFNPRYIIDVLKAIDDEKVICTFTLSSNPMFIKGAIDTRFRYMILPLRIRS